MPCGAIYEISLSNRPHHGVLGHDCEFLLSSPLFLVLPSYSSATPSFIKFGRPECLCKGAMKPRVTKHGLESEFLKFLKIRWVGESPS